MFMMRRLQNKPLASQTDNLNLYHDTSYVKAMKEFQ